MHKKDEKENTSTYNVTDMQRIDRDEMLQRWTAVHPSLNRVTQFKQGGRVGEVGQK